MDKKNPVARLKRRRKILNHLTTDFRIHLLGPPEILVGGRIPQGRLLDRPLAIFVYLAVSGGMIGRSHLTKIFWPDHGEREASTALSRALYTLEARGFGPLLEKSASSLRFLPPRGVSSSFDIGSFMNEAPPGYCRYLHEPDQCPECAQHLRGRIALYRGPFLEGVDIPPDSAPFEGWIAERRLFYEGVAGRLREILSDKSRHERPPAGDMTPHPSKFRRRALSTGEPREIVVLALIYTLDTRQPLEKGLAIAQTLRQTAEEIILRHGGWVPPHSLSGFLGYFGFPAALEFPARQAALAAREILECPAIASMRVPEKTGSRPLLLRMGILDGETTADIQGGIPDMTGQISTSAITLAGTTPDGTIAVPHSLFAALTPTFKMEEILTRPDPDGRAPIEIHLLGPKRTAPLSFSETDGLTSLPHSPFIGRKKEERLLDACWRRVKKGERKSVWITGEPGIGKSRFLSEFLSRVLAERGEAIVRELRCLPEDREIPWAPALRLFRSLLEISSDLSRADVILRSERYLKSLGRTTQEELSLFLHFLEGEGPWSKNLSRDSPGRIRQKIELLVSELVAKRSQNGPLILVIEDLHWIDFATVSLLLKSAHSSPAHRLMVLFTSRDPSHLSGSFPQPDLHIPLAPLSPRKTRELLSQVTFTPVLLSEQKRLVRRSGGNPFFLLELSREGEESSEKRSTIFPSSNLESILSTRVESLGEAAHTLALAACLGMQFSRLLLTRIVGAAPLKRHEPVLLKRGILRPSSGDPERLEFRHALIREHLMGSLPQKSTAIMHRKIARTLETHFPETPEGSPENIARHLAIAGESRSAASFYRKASERALAIGALQEAWNSLSSALALLPQGDSDRLPVLVAMGPLAAVIYGYAHETYRKIYQEAKTLVSDREITRATLPVWNGLRASLVGGEGPDAAREIALRIRSFADTEGTEEERLRARYAMGNLAYFSGRLEEAESHLRAALSLLPQIGDKAFGAPLGPYAEDAGVTALAYMGTVRLLRGYPGEARLWQAQASERAIRIGQTNSLCHAKVMEMFRSLYSREKQAVRQAAEELERMARERGFLQWAAFAELFACWSRENQEDPSPCREAREKISRILPGILPVFLAVEAEAALFAGRPEVVREILALALPLEAATGTSLVRSDLLRLRGEATIMEDRRDPRGCEDLRRAVEISRKDKNALFLLRAATALVRISPEDVLLLEEAVAGIAEGETLPGILEAKALLLALS